MQFLAIFCEDTIYSKRLADYLREKLNKEIFVLLFTEEKLFFEALTDKHIDRVAVDYNWWERLSCEEKKKCGNRTVYCFCDEISENCSEKITPVYKYMTAPDIAYAITGVNRNSKSEITGSESSTIVGVYSPCGGVGITSFSIALAKWIVRRKRVIFISLNGFSCLTEMMCLDEKLTLSEVIYDISVNHSENTEIGKYTQKFEEFDVIAPMRTFKELQGVEADVWKTLLLTISKEYDCIIVDFSAAVSGLMDLLAYCDHIIIDSPKGYVASGRYGLFEKELKETMTQDYFEQRVKLIDIPRYNNQPDGYEDIGFSPIGEYVKGLNLEI